MLIIFVVLLLPIAVVVATAVRSGGDQRDRRLAAIRLIGADAAMARWIAAGEASLAATLGLAVGGALFLIGRQAAERVTLWELSMFAADIRLSPPLAVLIVLAVPATAVGVTLLALRRIAIEPLGVVRRTAGRPRRFWWRAALPIGGVALLYPLRNGIDETSGSFNQAQVAVGVVLLLLGVAALLPWLVEAVVRRLGGGPVAWQLATRRLQLDSAALARMVSGVAVAVASGIALQMLFAGIEHNYLRQIGGDLPHDQARITTQGIADGAGIAAMMRRLERIEGVTGVLGTVQTDLVAAGTPRDRDGVREVPTTALRIGSCAALRELAALDRCADGDVFAVEPVPPTASMPAPPPGDHAEIGAPGAARPSPLPRPGQRLEVGASFDSRYTMWTVPANLRTVLARARTDGTPWTGGILATPGAVDLSGLTGLRMDLRVILKPGRRDAIEKLRNAVGVNGDLRVLPVKATSHVRMFDSIRRGLFIGVVVTLLLLGVSLLVGTVEQLRERRRLLAVLVAFGTRRLTLSWSVLWQTAIPVLLGLLLAIAIGTALGGTLLAMVGEPGRLDWPSIAAMSGTAGAVVLLVAAASLPALWRLLRPTGLRTE